MKWIAALEARFGHLAIPGLIRYVVALNALVYGLVILNPVYLQWLTLDPGLVAKGQVWRLVTYIFIPPMVGPLWILFALMFFWMIGEGLEQAWGSFRLNLFYFIGMAGCTVAAFFFGGGATNEMLNLSLIFAFATIYPDYVIYLFLIIPIKMKWLGWFSFALVMFTFLGGNLQIQAAIAASLGNYLIFFGPSLWESAKARRYAGARRREFVQRSMPEDEALHHCAVCKRTELTDPHLEFRVSRDGNEYCEEHLPSRAAAQR